MDGLMQSVEFTKGLHDLGDGAYAYLQPDRGTGAGWSNAGLLVDSGEALLVDTLRDELLTAEMLDMIEARTGLGAADIGTLVNTHRDADHVFGNRLLAHADIIASASCAQDMARRSPGHIAAWLRSLPDNEVGEYIWRVWGPPFKFEGFEPAHPKRTFSGRMDLQVGNKAVHLIEVGPAHTPGDVIVYVPQNRLVFSADIVFLGNTPAIWAGPIGNWIKALDIIEALDVDTIVPGHGPVTDKKGLRPVRDYLLLVQEEARARFDRGMTVAEAARDIELGPFREWGGAERLIQNVDHCYRSFRGDTDPIDRMELFALLAPFARELGCFPAALTPMKRPSPAVAAK